jgi:hypothetical protein
MIFDDPTLTRLLGSIEANRLVLLCGAGLSIPPPSDLMSAVVVHILPTIAVGTALETQERRLLKSKSVKAAN